MSDPDTGEHHPPRVAGSGRDILLGYLSPRGRVSRGDFLIRFAAPSILGAVALSSVLGSRSAWTLLLMSLLYWVYLAGLAKRLQDFGLPGLPIAGMVVLGLWLRLEAQVGLPAWAQTYVYAFFLVALIFAGSTSSEPRANVYGS